MKRTKTTAAAIGLSLATALTLSACANPLDSLIENVVSGGVENLIEDQTGVDINTGDGASLPDSWPSEVPTPDGNVLFSASAEGTYTATLEIAGAQVVDSLRGELEGSGFSLTQEADFGGLLNYFFEGDTYDVTVVYIPGEDGNADSLQYSVITKTE